MASIERRVRGGKVHWYVRYRDPRGRQRVKVFDRKADAQREALAVESSKLAGTFIDPRRAAIAFEAWVPQWLASQGHLKESTRDRYAGIVRHRILPRWSPVKLNEISHADIQRWISELAAEASPSAARKAHRVLSLILSFAVRDERLTRNPADNIGLPRERPRERRFLSHEQVQSLASGAGDYGVVVLFLAYTGTRFGEMAALRAGRIDRTSRRILIAESVTSVQGRLVWGTPKGHAHRTVSAPAFIFELLEERLARLDRDALVFTAPGGGPLRASNFRRDVFTPAARAVGLAGLVPHELRHTAASLAIASGADVKVVQQMLGHRSATMTLDLYGHLFEDRLTDVADRLDAAARAVSEFGTGPRGGVPRISRGPVERRADGLQR